MRLLPGTHIWIWSLTDPARLKPKVRAALAHRNADLWLASISVWEALVLIRKGRLRVKDGGGSIWIGEAGKRSPLREAPLTHAIALASQAIEAGQRLIAARTLKVLPN